MLCNQGFILTRHFQRTINSLQCRREKSHKRLCKRPIVKQFALLSKVCQCLDTERRREYETLEKGESQEGPWHDHINASPPAELLQPSFHCETRLEADSGTGIQNKTGGYCSWHVSLLWCKHHFSCFHVFEAFVPPASLLERRVLPSNGGWHAVSFYPHLVLSIFSLLPLFVCVIKSLRGF